MRIILGLLLSAFFATAAAAQTPPPQQETPQALSDVFACANTQDDAARLACYDAAVGRLHTAQQQGQVVSIDRERASSLQRESFGFSLPNLAHLLLPSSRGDDADTNSIQSEIQRIITRHYDVHAFVLANGQTWTQIQPQSVGNVRVGDTITIRRAALGSFMLISPRGGAGHRVRREE